MEGNGGKLGSIETDENAGNDENKETIENTKNVQNTGTNKSTSGHKNNSTTKYKMTIEEAVERTIDDCIREGILVDILTKFRAEVKKMSIFEYNARLHEETLKKEGYEDGFEDGREDGREQGELKKLLKLVKKKLEKEKTYEVVAEELETAFAIVEQIGEVIKNAAPDSSSEDLLGILIEKNIKLDD